MKSAGPTFAAIMPLSRSIQLCVAEPGAAAAPEVEKFPLDPESIAAIGARLRQYDQPLVAFALRRPGYVWEMPDDSRFQYEGFPPNFEDWLRYRAAWSDRPITAEEIDSGIYLILRSKAWMFPIVAQRLDTLPLDGREKKDARWLLELLREGKLRFAYGRPELRLLAERVEANDPWAIEESIAVIEETTDGYWHGRGRSLLSRRLAGRDLSDDQQRRFLEAVLGRLESGKFFMHFKGGLRTAMEIDPQTTAEAARQALDSDRDYVRRYAQWVLDRLRASAEH